MKKISEYKDEEALDLLAELLEPAVIIMADKEVAEAIKSGERIPAISAAIKNHKPQVMQILAIMEGIPADQYHCNVFTLPMRVLEILNDEALVTFFTSQAQEMKQSTYSGPVTESTKANEA